MLSARCAADPCTSGHREGTCCQYRTWHRSSSAKMAPYGDAPCARTCCDSCWAGACARAMADVLQPDDEDIMLRAMEEQEARMEKQEAEQKVGEGGAAAAAARTAASLFSVPVCCEPRPARQSRWPILSWLLGCRPCFVRWKCSPEAGEVAVPVVVICG